MPGTSVNPTGLTDLKTDNEVKTYTEILAVVKSYAIIRGEKQWDMLEIACKARAIYGDGREAESKVRALFFKAFEEVREDKSTDPATDTLLQSDKATSYRVVKVAFTFEVARIKRMKKDGLPFIEIHKRAVEERKALEGKGKGKREEASEPVAGDVTPAARGHPAGYIAPEASGQMASSRDADDWLEESLHIIDDDHTFPRFLKMVREARESDILIGKKLEELKKIVALLLTLSGAVAGLWYLNYVMNDANNDGIPDALEKALGLEDNTIEKKLGFPDHAIEKALPKLHIYENRIHGPSN